MTSLEQRLARLLEGDDRDPQERDGLLRLMLLLAGLPPPPDPLGMSPDYAMFKDRFLAASRGTDGEILEETFLALYVHLHGFEAPYTPDERKRVDETGGYWCHAGGLSPILKAGPHLGPDSVSGDFGAGNGLQTLLMQKLHPHRKSIQIEISSRMVDAGRRLQDWLGIPGERVEWVTGDVMDATPAGMDFVYLYRPVRPEGRGLLFYERLASGLDESGPVVIFSIADCLGPFLPERFETIYSDGHLTCYRSR